MSGHSKWATIKHRKGAVDKARGKLFARILRQVEVAAREGGGDLEANPTLRTMYQKARDASVPVDTIERALKRGTGELEGVRYEPIAYEGYAPNGVAVYVETLSDNRNRTGAEIRSIFSKNGGSSAEPGAVAWQFERKGALVVAKTGDDDELQLVAIDAGAEDIADQGDSWYITTAATDLAAVRDGLEAAGVKVESSDLTMIPSTVVALESEADARKVLKVIEALEDHDDVQAVYSNFDVPDEVLAAVSGD